ncbi:MAG: hypothetical protein QM572_07590 [Nocardioides sp.]|uniref:HAAS signaling domain-containing protein n=1 Tax=Nocardioides sp. TaxID=35761 RepID=UPI0039E52958
MTTTKPDQTMGAFLGDFLAAVRAELSDLSVTDRAEITDGLEADLAELVADRGPEALGDPVAYARELRSAAGIPERSGTRTARRSLGDRITALLDAARAVADRQIARLPGDHQPLIDWLRPLWWIVRGAAIGGIYAGNDGLGPGPVIVAITGVAISVQLGRGRLWPGGRRGVLARVVLLAVNAASVVAAIVSVSLINDAQQHSFWNGWESGYEEAQGEYGSVDAGPAHTDEAGIYSDGHWVSQVFPYDAAGNPLVGVQLFDQTGRPISVVTQPDCTSTTTDPLPREEPTAGGELNYVCQDEESGEALQSRIFYPWTNGAAQLYNVFPLTSRTQNSPDLSATAFAEELKPSVGTLPFATVPPVSLPGVATTPAG